jgi:hypothetical protein
MIAVCKKTVFWNQHY